MSEYIGFNKETGRVEFMERSAPRPLADNLRKELGDGTKEIQISEKETRFHLDRLDGMLAIKWEYFSGNLPKATWGSGEKREVRHKNQDGSVSTTEQEVTLPFMQQGREKGLLYALNAAITSEVDILNKSGLKEIVHERLIFDSHMPGGNPGRFDGEDCRGK